MLVHPNPMEQKDADTWEDTKLGRVQVRFFMVNYGHHRKRWGVYARRRVGAPFTILSRHITPEQAVVSAQTLANRIYRLLEKNKRRKSKKLTSLTITPSDRTNLMSGLDVSLEYAEAGDYGLAQERAREVIKQIQRDFKLNH